MKKLILFFLILGYTISVYPQYQAIQANESGLAVRTKLNSMFSQLFSNNTALSFSVDGSTNWHSKYAVGDYYMRVSDDYGATWSAGFPISNTAHSVLSNLEWTDSNHTGTVNTYAGFDASGNATTYSFSSSKSIFSINLPYASTVAGRIALATDYPAGWTLTANGVNLVVTHNLGRWCTDVKVFSVINGTQRQQLRLSAAENGLTALSANQAEVYSLSTIAKDIVVYLYFE